MAGSSNSFRNSTAKGASAGTDDADNPIDPIMDLLFFAPLGFAVESVNLFPEMAKRGRTEVSNAKVIGGFAITKFKRTVGADDGPSAGPTSSNGEVLSLQKVGADLLGALLPKPPKKAAPKVVSSTATESAGASPSKGAGDPKTVIAAGEAKKATKKKASTAKKPPAKKSSAKANKTPKKKAGVKKASSAGKGGAKAKKTAAKKSAAKRSPATKAGTTKVVAVTELAIPGYDELSASQVVPMLRSLNKSELRRIQRYESANRGRKTILGQVAQLLS